MGSKSILKQVVHGIISSLWIAPIVLILKVLVYRHSNAFFMIGLAIVLAILWAILWGLKPDPIPFKVWCSCGRVVLVDTRPSHRTLVTVCKCGSVLKWTGSHYKEME